MYCKHVAIIGVEGGVVVSYEVTGTPSAKAETVKWHYLVSFSIPHIGVGSRNWGAGWGYSLPPIT